MKYKAYIFVSLLFACGLGAESWTPLNLSVNSDITIFKQPNIRGLDLFWGMAESETVYGAQIGIGGARVESELAGIQLSLCFNELKGSGYGVQTAFVNEAKSLNGIQLACLGNLAQYQMNGFQFGVLNGVGITSGELKGQFDASVSRLNGGQLGIANIAYYTNGMQIGVINSANGINGIQIGFFCSAIDTKGVQVGFINKSTVVKGVQIGVLNICKSLQGVQIGILNIARDNTLPVMVGMNVGF